MTDEIVAHALTLLDQPVTPDADFTLRLRDRFLIAAASAAPPADDRSNERGRVRAASVLTPGAAGRRWDRTRRWPVVAAVALATASAVVVAAILVAQRPSPPPAPILDDPPPADPVNDVTPTAAPVRTAPALGTDQPCTRALPAGTATAPVPFRAEDLPRMVLSQEELGPDVTGFESDLLRNGYHHNVELPGIEVHPSSLCEDLERFGRIIGYGRGYDTYEQRSRRVLTAVHLFWDAPGATAWVESFVDGAGWGVGTDDGPSRFEATSLGELGPGSWMLEHVGPEGTRSWAIVQRGPVVGWVVDLHPGPEPTIDVADAARRVVERIEQVTLEATDRFRDVLDVAQLMSVPVPLADLGETYAGLVWNEYWGGCTDLDEWAMIVDDAAVERARQFDMTGLCTGMYGPDGAPEGTFLQIWTRVSVFPDAASADAYLTSELGGEPFDVEGLSADEAYGVVREPLEDGDPWGTRVAFRRGRYVLSVGLNEDSGRDARAELTATAVLLDSRLNNLLAGGAPVQGP